MGRPARLGQDLIVHSPCICHVGASDACCTSGCISTGFGASGGRHRSAGVDCRVHDQRQARCSSGHELVASRGDISLRSRFNEELAVSTAADWRALAGRDLREESSSREIAPGGLTKRCRWQRCAAGGRNLLNVRQQNRRLSASKPELPLLRGSSSSDLAIRRPAMSAT